jgi:membrane-bound lytic murein transglycosylase D
LSSWTTQKVTSARERIETIAARFGTTPQVIREVNNIPPKMVLKEGSTILVPKTALTSEKDIAPEVADNATMTVIPDVPETRRIIVKVGKRDNLASIAQRYKVSVAQIKSWNRLKQDKLAMGQKLELQVPNKVMAVRRNPRQQLAKNGRAQPVKKVMAHKPVSAKTRVVAKPAAKVVKQPSKSVKMASTR